MHDREDDDGDEWSKSFLAHPYCGATLDDIWCGDSIWFVIMYMMTDDRCT